MTLSSQAIAASTVDLAPGFPGSQNPEHRISEHRAVNRPASSLTSILWVEWLKYRRTTVLWMPLIASLGMVIIAAIIAFQVSHDPTELASFGPKATPQRVLVLMLTLFWGVFWMPFQAAILTGMAADLESRSGVWRVLRSRATKPAALYAGKLKFLFGISVLGGLALIAATALIGGGLFGFDLPWIHLLTMTGLMVAINLPLLAIHLWIGTDKGLGVSVMIAVGLGLIVGQIFRDRLWPVLPWVWPNLLVGDIQKQLEIVGDPANIAVSLVPLFALATGVLAAAFVGGMVWFGRREER